jgi:porin
MIQNGFISVWASRWCTILLIAVGAAASGQQLITPAPRDLSIPIIASHYSREALDSLGQRGVSIHSTFINDLSKSPFSTHGYRDWFSRYSFDLSVDVDGKKTMRWEGSSFHLDLKRHANVAGQMYRDVAQAYSNIDADPQMYLYEAWLLQSFAQDRVEVQLGQMDANARFATVATAADFLNSSMGYNPTIMGFPTYPHPKPGVEVSLKLPESYRIAAAGFQTDVGKMTLAAGEKRWARDGESTTGLAQFGYWKLHQPPMTRDGEQVSGTHGYYAVLEQRIWNHEGGNGSSTRRLNGFLQLGTGDDRENSFRSHLGCGFVLQSPFSRRPADSVGAAMTWVRLSGDPSPDGSSNGELVSEEYYKLTLKSGVALVADTQYFANPGAGVHSSPFFVLTPRVVFTF